MSAAITGRVSRFEISGRLAFFVGVLAAGLAAGQDSYYDFDCPRDPTPFMPGYTQTIITGDYALSIGSAGGAVGDVVGIPVRLQNRVANRGWGHLQFVVCHDPAVAELVGAPSYSEELLSLVGNLGVHHSTLDPSGIAQKHGPVLDVNLGYNSAAYEARFPSEVPLLVMTLYYRLKGAPGDTGSLSSCEVDPTSPHSLCFGTTLHTYSWDNPQGWDFVSRSHTGGVLTVLEGPATHPDRPPEPPAAKVYPELPPPATVNFQVRIEGTSARPGSREVPVEVYASADLEYSGILIPIDFDERYLRLSHVEERFVGGTVLSNNADALPGPSVEEGTAVIFSGLGVGSRRIAAEGEEIHAATIYFDVEERASEIGSTTLEVRPVIAGPGALYKPWIGVHHLSGVHTGDSVVRSEIEPITITHGVLAIRGEDRRFLRGDSNGDRAHDLSDSLTTLGFLFLGSDPPACADAADANDDGLVDITDPITSLQVLFFGGGTLPDPAGAPGEDPTPDLLDC